MRIEIRGLDKTFSDLPESNQRHFDNIEKPLQSNALPTELKSGYGPST